MRIDVQQPIEDRISKAKYGDVFITSDFIDIATFDSANKALIRLAENGTLRRIMRGIYDKPKFNSFLGENIAPSADNVARAIARNFGWTIVPCGDTALNLLGLSTQVPSVWLYVSDGTYKEYSYDKTVIRFKRTTNKEISKLSYSTALVVQAIKAIGRDKITDADIGKIAEQLTPSDKIKMLAEAKSTTSWVYELIKGICRGGK